MRRVTKLPLTRREIEILTFAAAGWSNRQISDEADISHQTVKNHLTTIYDKMDMPDRTAACVKGIMDGILDEEKVRKLMKEYVR